MSDSALEALLLCEIEKGERGRSVAPETVARAHSGEDWRRALPQVKAAAIRLARQGRIVILRHGKPADPDSLKGVYRLGRVDGD